MEIDQINDFFGDLDLFLLDWILKGELPQNGKILDAGAGSGRNLSYFLKNGYHVTALDKNPSEIRLLNFTTEQLGFGSIGEVGDLMNLSFEDDYFDFIICSRVLHFADNQDSFLKMLSELKRVLTKNGQLYLSMASGLRLSVDLKEVANGKVCYPNGKARFILNQELLADFSQSWEYLAEPRTVIFGDKVEETTLILRAV